MFISTGKRFAPRTVDYHASGGQSAHRWRQKARKPIVPSHRMLNPGGFGSSNIRIFSARHIGAGPDSVDIKRRGFLWSSASSRRERDCGLMNLAFCSTSGSQHWRPFLDLFPPFGNRVGSWFCGRGIPDFQQVFQHMAHSHPTIRMSTRWNLVGSNDGSMSMCRFSSTLGWEQIRRRQ